MRRKLLGLALAASTLISLVPEPAVAASVFPGAGYGVKNLAGMAVKFTLPELTCPKTDASTLLVGVISPAIGTTEGWNAAAMLGCTKGQMYSRIQVWVNSVGGQHLVADARPGDQIRVRLMNAGSKHPTIDASDLTHPATVRATLPKATTVAAAGAYAGAFVPKFDHINLNVWANRKPLNKNSRVQRDEHRGRTLLMDAGGVWSNANFTLHFRHR